MTPSATPSILIVPGLRDHVADHWQTLLAARLQRVHTVPPLTEDKLSCAARVAAIDQALHRIQGPVIVVAHSAGAMMLVHWAKQSTRAIHGALLATPADLETPMPTGYPITEQLASNGWLPIPSQPLPFPSIVAASSNDPLASLERTRALATAWGSQLIELGAVGHLNPASGFGEWPQALELIHALT